MKFDFKCLAMLNRFTSASTSLSSFVRTSDSESLNVEISKRSRFKKISSTSFEFPQLASFPGLRTQANQRIDTNAIGADRVLFMPRATSSPARYARR